MTRLIRKRLLRVDITRHFEPYLQMTYMTYGTRRMCKLWRSINNAIIVNSFIILLINRKAICFKTRKCKHFKNRTKYFCFIWSSSVNCWINVTTEIPCWNGHVIKHPNPLPPLLGVQTILGVMQNLISKLLIFTQKQNVFQ